MPRLVPLTVPASPQWTGINCAPTVWLGFPGGSDDKVPARNAGHLGLIPGSGRSPGEGNGNPLHCSCLENPMDGGAWWATVRGVAKSRTQLSYFTFTFLYLCLALCLMPRIWRWTDKHHPFLMGPLTRRRCLALNNHCMSRGPPLPPVSLLSRVSAVSPPWPPSLKLQPPPPDFSSPQPALITFKHRI